MSSTALAVIQPKKKSLACASFQTFNEVIPPMDYSFCRIESISAANDEEPRYPVSPRGKAGKQPPPEPEEGRKSEGKCLKMNNNSITTLVGLPQFAQTKFTDWQKLAWIDLSQNELTTLGPELTEFENLQILYLHGNQIGDIAKIEQLIPLSRLRKLTLHGNPLENCPGYRHVVLGMLPNLQSLDFSCVTKADRITAKTMNSFAQKKKKKVVEED